MRQKKIQAPPGFYGCPKCREIKPVSAFPFKGGGKRECYCRPCKQAMKVERREAMAGKPDPTIERRYWPKVLKGDGCWEWQGARTKRGYGVISYQGRDEMAHRVAVVLDGRRMPQLPMVVDHICKNVRCVNPAHLRIVTQFDNITIYADYARRGERVRAYLLALPKVQCGCGRSIGATGYGYHRKVCPHAQKSSNS